MSKAKDVLKSENKMLEQLVAKIEAFAKDYPPGFEAENLKCWGKELSDYITINNKYIAMSDADFKKALMEEIEMLDGCRNSITKKSDAAEYWKNNMKDNKYYTEGLLPLI